MLLKVQLQVLDYLNGWIVSDTHRMRVYQRKDVTSTLQPGIVRVSPPDR